jgi:hypothetical protein
MSQPQNALLLQQKGRLQPALQAYRSGHSEVTRLLLVHLMSNNKDYLNALEESLFALELSLTA